MKIAFLTTYDFATSGGVKNHILNLAKEFTAMGHDCTIIAPSSRPLFLKNFIQIANFPSAAKTAFIPPHLLIGFKAIMRLHKLLNKSNFDLLHIHEPLIPILCLSALFHKKTPLFATFHTYYELGQPMYRLFQPIFNLCLKRLRGRIAVSESAKAYISRYFTYDYKIIPNGVNISQFQKITAPPAIITPGFFNLLFVGHAQFKRKGLRYMLEAYRILKPNYPNLRLIIVGATWNGREHSKNLTELSLPDIIYLGSVSDETLVGLYQAADIFCAPSTGNESFGIVLLEAMAAQTPIVASKIDGYMNVVEDQKEAILVPPRQSVKLAEAIKYLIDNPKIRQQLTIQGKKKVQQYAFSKVAKDVMDYYGTK